MVLALKWNIITAFSIPRNYYKLVQPAKNEIERDLRVAQGIRLFFLYFMVFSHATIGYAIEIVVNPEYYERVSYTYIMQPFIPMNYHLTELPPTPTCLVIQWNYLHPSIFCNRWIYVSCSNNGCRSKD